MQIVAVVIFFKPKLDAVDAIRALACEEIKYVIVINESSDEIRRLVAAIPYVSLVVNDSNIGLAVALNQGIAEALRDSTAEAVLLLDQDSKPSAAMIGALHRALTEITASGSVPSCVGPRLVDIKAPAANVGGTASGGTHEKFTVVESLATSGTLIPRNALHRTGLMMEQLFIDCIDHEWCLRASSLGMQAFLVNDAVMMHDMGEGAFNYFGRFKPIHRSPIRHYYIIRNNFILMRLPHIPLWWKIKQFLKTIRRFFAYILLSNDRVKTTSLMLRAVGEGVTDKIHHALSLGDKI